MDWLWWVLGGLVVLGVISKGSQENAKKAEEVTRKERAEAARIAIMASGDKDAIRQLHLMEASYQHPTSGNRAVLAGPASGALGTAAAVAGGIVVGNAISSSVQAAQLEAAFADLQADLDAAEIDLADGASLDELDLDLNV